MKFFTPPAVAVAAAFVSKASGFGIPEGIHAVQSAAAPLGGLYGQYQNALIQHPLPTQVATGASLAVVGDAIAQAANPEATRYDARRATSFAIFDMAYRTLQHAIFPWMVIHCHGQILGGAIPDAYAAAVEQTLFNQLLVIPTVYYPVFFLISGSVQGLSVEQSIERGRNLFLPILKRNLQFWIPVQFAQFGFVSEELWIPSSCVAGLAWTIILSVSAGSVAPATKPQDAILARQAAEGAAADPEPVSSPGRVVSKV